MANYADILETQHTLEATVLNKMSHFEAQLKAKMPHPGVSLLKIQEEFQDFKVQVYSIIKLLQQQITGTSKVLDDIEMRHRRKYLLLSGVSEDVNPNLSQFIVQTLHDKLGISGLTKEKITACHRLGKFMEGKCRPVLLRFSELALKSEVWRRKTSFKGTPYAVSEFLTRQRQLIFVEARKRLGMRKCWTTDGNVIAKLSDGSIKRIFKREDLDGLVQDNIAIDNQEITEPTSPARLKPKRGGRPRK
ncbi:uncharacterized protein ACR2FA_001604 [Aphomia sociella]